jgi:hypothetical protein
LIDHTNGSAIIVQPNGSISFSVDIHGSKIKSGLIINYHLNRLARQTALFFGYGGSIHEVAQVATACVATRHRRENRFPGTD